MIMIMFLLSLFCLGATHNSSSSPSITTTTPGSTQPTPVHQSEPRRPPVSGQSATTTSTVHQSGVRAAPAPSQSTASIPQAGTRPMMNNLVTGQGEEMCLDRTPTDDEINWLWQRVRSCLNTKRPTNTSSDPLQQQNLIHNNQPYRSSVTYHYKYPVPSTSNGNSVKPNITSPTPVGGRPLSGVSVYNNSTNNGARRGSQACIDETPISR